MLLDVPCGVIGQGLNERCGFAISDQAARLTRTGVDVSEDSLGRQELGHGLSDKVGHDQQEGLRDVLEGANR